MDDYFSALAQYVKNNDSTAIRSFLSNDTDEQKLIIFRNTFLSSCVETLKRRFPSCVTVLGNDFFHEISRQYVELNTPRSKVLADYGESMPAFLDNALKAQNLENLGYVTDLAKLDNAWNEVYFASRNILPNEQDLARWMENIDSISLSLCTSASLIMTQWGVSNVWSALKSGALTEQYEITPEKEYILMWRDTEGLILHHSLTHEEWLFIYSIKQGKSLTLAAEEASGTGEIDISTVFSQLIANNLLIEKV